jgi:prevent-host-death family protein
MTIYSVEETAAQFAQLLERVMNGEHIIITEDGKPVAVMQPIGAVAAPRVPGGDAGKVRIGNEFDVPLLEFD